MPRPESHPSKRPARYLAIYIFVAFVVACVLGFTLIRDNQHGKADTTISGNAST